jgi:hypothetical protein
VVAVWFYVRVNKERVGSFYAQRREHVIPDDGECTYDVQMDDFREARKQDFAVRHRPDDGVFVLLAKAIGVFVEG